MKRNVGTFIKKLREDNKISEKDLAESIGVSVLKIKLWEKGWLIPKIYDLELLSFKFGITVNELLSGEKQKMKDDDKLYEYSKKQRNKHNLGLIARVLLLLIIIVCFANIIVFIIKQNKINIYTINGESDNFFYNNAMFVSSEIKYIYVPGNLKIKSKNISMNDITYISLKSDNRVIIGSDQPLDQLCIENYGYNNLFPQEVVDNLDNWYLEISYKVNDISNTEIIQLNNEYIMNKVKVKPIV